MDSQTRIFVFYHKYPSYIESIEHDHSIEAGLGASNLVLSDNWKRISKLIEQQAAANQSSIEEFSSIDDVKIKTISFLANLVDDFTMILDDEKEMKWIPLFKDKICQGCKKDCSRKDYLPV